MLHHTTASFTTLSPRYKSGTSSLLRNRRNCSKSATPPMSRGGEVTTSVTATCHSGGGSFFTYFGSNAWAVRMPGVCSNPYAVVCGVVFVCVYMYVYSCLSYAYVCECDRGLCRCCGVCVCVGVVFEFVDVKCVFVCVVCV